MKVISYIGRNTRRHYYLCDDGVVHSYSLLVYSQSHYCNVFPVYVGTFWKELRGIFMKIAFYTPTLAMGGYEKVVVGYANEFSRKHQITIVCGKAEGPLAGDISDSVALVDFKCRTRGFLKNMTAWLKVNTVDILYVPFVPFTIMTVIAKKRSGAECVVYGAQHGFEQKHPVMDKIWGRLVNKADVLTAVSNAVANYESERFLIKRNRYSILDNPVIDSRKEIISHSHKWLGENKKYPVLIVSGRIAEGKRMDLAIRIFAEVLIQKEARMIVLGDGPEKTKIEQLANELGISSKIDFLGYVQKPEGYMIGADVFLHTARIEAFGNVVVEALHCNLPVVVTDCGGPIDIIEGDRYGINIGVYDAPDIVRKGAEAVIRILEGKIKFEGMQKKALKYDVKNLEGQFLEPYYECNKKN